MDRKHWGRPTSWDEVCRRAGGRRHYNSMRQFQRELRLLAILERTHSFLPLLHRTGAQKRLAAELGVSASTISRDVKRLLNTHTYCPTCGHYVPKSQLSETD